MSKQVYKQYSGTNGQYRALHNWVERRLGKPQKCEECGTSEKIRYEWSNISGEYRKDTSDWRRLCVPCHKRIDKGGMCRSGRHKSTPDNIYTPPSGRKTCHPCKRESQRKYKERLKEKMR